MDRSIDNIIVGLGLTGSAMAWELSQRGQSVMVFDQPLKNRASSVAAGLFNPITGKVMSKSWRADLIFPAMDKFYSGAESKLGKKFMQSSPIYRPFGSAEERALWKERIRTNGLERFVMNFYEATSGMAGVLDPFGGIEMQHTGFLKVQEWTTAVCGFLKAGGNYREEEFEEEQLYPDDKGISYKDLRARRIIFCNGLEALRSKWFGYLPLKPLKGETVDVIMEMDLKRILNKGVYIIPTETASRFKVGATYRHPPFEEGPTKAAREELTSQLKGLVKGTFEVVHQDWGIRPTTPDRRPLLGAHPAYKNVIIFNGVGTKGVSLAPYFANHLADWLEGRGDMEREVNINRFKSLYSK